VTTKLYSGYPDLVRYLQIMNLWVTDILNPDDHIHLYFVIGVSLVTL